MRGLHPIAAAALACLVLAGCTDDPDPEPNADMKPSASPSGGESHSASTSPTPSEPSGELIEVENVSLRAPVTWTVEYSDAGVGQGMSLFPPTGAARNSIAVYVRKNHSTYTLKDFEDFAIEEMRGVEDPEAKRLHRTTLGGQPAYHIRGRDEIVRYDHYGSIRDGTSIYINFQLSGTRRERQLIIDEVLNSVEWK